MLRGGYRENAVQCGQRRDTSLNPKEVQRGIEAFEESKKIAQKSANRSQGQKFEQDRWREGTLEWTRTSWKLFVNGWRNKNIGLKDRY